MKQRSTVFLRGVIWLIGLGILALCLFALPSGIMSDTEGYLRPIFIGMYIPAIPFFIALYQGLKLLRYIDMNTAFSPLSVTALKNIKYCGVAIAVLYTAGLPYIHMVAQRVDPPLGIMASIIIGASLVIAVFAALLQKLLQNAIDIKSENDLTV